MFPENVDLVEVEIPVHDVLFVSIVEGWDPNVHAKQCDGERKEIHSLTLV